MGDIPPLQQNGAPTDLSRPHNVPPVAVTTVPSAVSSGPGVVATPTSPQHPHQQLPPYHFQGQVALDYAPSAGFPPMIQQQYVPPIPQHQQQQPYIPAHLDMAQAQGPQRPMPYNMSAMANALPQQAGYRPGQYGQGQHQLNPTTAPPTMGIQVPPTGHYRVPATMAAAVNQQYYMPQQVQAAPYYGAPGSPAQQAANMGSRTNPGYYPPMVQQPAPAPFYYAQTPAHYPQNMQSQVMPGQYVAAAGLPPIDPRLAQSQATEKSAHSPFSPDQGSMSSEGRQNIVRGPPRKPKQSGHAIWIGNLPPQTDLMSLVHHVCKETVGLESLFLISKSNCAFANFKDEATCISAQQKLHDSKFQTVRLVSRLRKSTVEGATGTAAPTGPASSTPQQGAGSAQNADTSEQDITGTEEKVESPVMTTEHAPPPVPAAEGPPQKDKFFILKSLTVEDLELSVRTNIWATQAHNEENLNGAFKSVDNVYLIFSANKSGEYFGYARMISPINDDPAAAIEFAPKAAAQSAAAADLGLPKAIPTEATEFAPKGRIIDDSARGTIFWEAERDEPAAEGDDDAESGGGSVGEDTSSVRSGQDSNTAGGMDEAGNKEWGKPFRLEWLSTTRLPFYRTRGLRNPWNSNREVKIARDGTELEPSVGRKLIGLFHRVQSPAVMPVPGVMPGMPGGVRGPMPPMVGYSMRPPYGQ